MTKVSGGVTLGFVAGCFVGGTILLVFVLFFVINNWEWISTTPGAWISTTRGVLIVALVYGGAVILIHRQRKHEVREHGAERQREAEAREREAEKQREAEARRREAERQREAEARQREAEKQRRTEAGRREAERQQEVEARENMAGKLRQWWEVLGISSQAPLEEITRRYRQEIQLYHPDRVVGLAPEIVSVAERHTKEINAAYAEAKRLRR
jgi:DnaJ-domain-containing protein 1